MASANTGQSLTITGNGLVAADQMVFSAVDTNGRLFEQTVTPTSVAADGTSLTVTVPANATTGHVRLARDAAGILLQIVPTLGDVTMGTGGGFTGATLTLTGTGFAEGASAVLFGGQRVADVSRSYGLDVYGSNNTVLNLTVPEGVATGPIRVSTIGGTSAAFGLALTGITAQAASGAAAGTGASANPGQTITLNGTGFDTSLDCLPDHRRGRHAQRRGGAAEHGQRQGHADPGAGAAQCGQRQRAAGGRRQRRERGAAGRPTVTDVQVASVSGDGRTAQVILSGLGFVEGGNSEYRFGTGAAGAVVLDAGASTGPDVQQVYDAVRGQYVSGQVVLTVPLSSGVFGPISVRTAGGRARPTR